jgi:23S rRNA pseudouridine2604 synthase
MIPPESDPVVPPATPSDGERLAKRLARQLPCSRSEAERHIEAGRVTVDGVVVDVPQHRVHDRQRVEVAPGASPASWVPATLLLHKPAGVDATGERPPAALALLRAHTRFAGDASGLPVLARHLSGQRCLTPLAAASGGLVVFSQDPRVVRRLLDAAAPLEHETMVEVAGRVPADALAALARPASTGGRAADGPKVSISRQSGDTTGVRVASKGAVPGGIEAAFEAAGLRATAIRRTRIGRVPLAGLPVGQWRCLLPNERF